MKIGTICFPIKNSQVLLGLKVDKKGFGAGKWNGFGGKIKQEETDEDAAVREIYEESGLIVSKASLEKVAFIRFFESGEEIYQVTVFKTYSWEGVETNTEEMEPRWFEISDIPYDQMWTADREWIPLVLSGKKFDGIVYFKEGMNEFEKFEWKEW